MSSGLTWEYTILRISTYGNATTGIAALNKMGTEGWELVSTVPYRGGENDNDVKCFMKRPRGAEVVNADKK